MGLVVLRGNCPTNRGSCPIGVIVQRSRCPKGVIGRGVVVLQGSLSYGVVVLEPRAPCSMLNFRKANIACLGR